MRRWTELAVLVVTLTLTLGPIALGPALEGAEWVGAACTVAGAACLAGWRLRPGPVLVAGPALVLVPLWLGPEPSDLLLLVLTAYAALLAEHLGGRTARLGVAAYVGYLTLLYVVSGDRSIGLVMLTLPGFLAGTALRLRRETAEALAERGRELEHERALFTELSVRNERARIASELHDIVGHALSVMVVQAAAGQRLVGRSPESAAASLAVIAESARQGRADLHRLVDLLAGGDVASPDLSLVEEIVTTAAHSGLQVTCRLEGEREGLDADAAHVAFRVVQESLTNALRHAPGAEVRVLVQGTAGGRSVTVRVENGPAAAAVGRPLIGTGRGLVGLRERVLGLGGSFAAGPSAAGGWLVEASLGR